MLIRQIIASDLCTAFGCQQFCKGSTKCQRRISLNVTIPFSMVVCSLAVNVMFQKSILSKQNVGGQAVVRGGMAPWPPVATTPAGSLN